MVAARLLLRATWKRACTEGILLLGGMLLVCITSWPLGIGGILVVLTVTPFILRTVGKRVRAAEGDRLFAWGFVGLSCVWVALLYGAYILSANGKESAIISVCTSNLKMIGLACRMYAADHHGAFPNRLKDLVPEYCYDKRLTCPGAHRKHMNLRSEIVSETQEDYFLCPGLTQSFPTDAILCRDKDGNHPDGRVNVLHVSGRVETTGRPVYLRLWVRPGEYPGAD